tara:strand:+ start:766 stop:1176 length:411 start_codon:yes stop_codon:yes gene_type:complete
MNPLVLKSAAKGAKKVLTNKYVLIIIAVLGSWFILRGGIKRMIRKWRERKFNKNESKDVNQIAQGYRSAANPSGVSWMIDFDGTDDEAIEKLAYQTKGSLDEVAQAYRQKFDEALTDRLRKELDVSEFQNWRNIVT